MWGGGGVANGREMRREGLGGIARMRVGKYSGGMTGVPSEVATGGEKERRRWRGINAFDKWVRVK